MADSGNIIDEDDGRLRGGRLGVYCDSQEQITWSALSYKCNRDVARQMYDDLPTSLRERVGLEV